MPAGSGLALNFRVLNIFFSTGFDDIGTDAYLWNNFKSQLSCIVKMVYLYISSFTMIIRDINGMY